MESKELYRHLLGIRGRYPLIGDSIQLCQDYPEQYLQTFRIM